MRILILGGTGEARKLAEALSPEFDVTSSFAGVTAAPLLPAGDVRRGGFGGEAGLMQYAESQGFAAIIDATHPYAERISRHGFSAASGLGIPYLRLERAPWVGDDWTEVATVAAAAASLPSGARAFVTIGRKEIAPFFARLDIAGVARMIEPPVTGVPSRWQLILARPPFTVASELHLVGTCAITHLVTKNAGGESTIAKLSAARQKNLAIVMVARPPKPTAPAFATAPELIAALHQMLSS